MLPSTGYFKTINCPFFVDGSCDRPYCHFRHARREDASATARASSSAETQALAQPKGTKTATATTSNPNMLQQLVTEAVKKVLADQEVKNTQTFSENIVSQVVEELKPTLAPGPSNSIETPNTPIIGKHMSIPAAITQPCVYNPTPIAELKKRHIPVAPYLLTRESRVAVKRKSSPDKIKPWLSIVQEPSISKEPEVTYKPTAIVNTNDNSGQGYVPMFKSDSSSSASYEDSNSNDYMLKIKEAYYPKLKKKREEYVPKKIKAPLKNVQHLDDTALDQFEPEFNMIDEILTAAQTVNSATPSEESQDYCLDRGSKFSDDEFIEANTNILNKEKVTSNVNIELSDYKQKENLHYAEFLTEMKQSYKNEIYYNHHDQKFKDEKDSTSKWTDSELKLQKHDSHQHKDKSKEKTDSSIKKSVNKDKSTSSSKSKHKDTGHHSSSKKSKERHRHESRSRDKRHSSSHKTDKDKGKSSHSSKKSSHRSRERSHSHKYKESEKDRKNRHKSSRHDKHKSSCTSSKSKNEKHSSDKSHHSRKYRSRSRQRSSSSRKHSYSKESSSEKDQFEHDERSNSSSESISFLENTMLEISDDDDVQEECLKIFKEYRVSDHPKVVSIKEDTKQNVDDIEETGRKRVAHPSAGTSVCKQIGASQPPKRQPNPQQRMYERWRLMREAAAEKAAEKAAAITKAHVTPISAVQPASMAREEPVATSNDLQLNENGRIRIAHVPYAMSLAMEKKKVTETKSKLADEKLIDKTKAQTTKSGVRVAHIPQVIPQLIRPEPLHGPTHKFPLNVRQYYINIMHDICIQIYTIGEDAAERAVKEEFACYDRCKALSVYKNSCMLAVHRLRKEVDQSTSNNPTATVSGTVSHEAMLAGKSKGSWSVMKTKKVIVDFKGSALYSMLKRWILTDQQLKDNGFPRKHPDGSKGRAKVYVISTRNQSTLSKVPNERFCSRCGSSYMVNKQGFPVEQQNCIFHWGRKVTFRGESKYSCCQQFGSATGCCDAKTHVWDYTDYENLRGYVATLPRDGPEEEQGVYALDCEMCYTTQGLELTRVTVINDDCNVVYETLVKPQNPILDYNTRFSGITEDDMKDVSTTLLDVQATLLTMFSDKTILVGHSLESDFKALRLLHDTVVDTSVMFPHKGGYPQKRALKNLCSEYLRKLIQNDVGGHDSKEDALACMELVRWKVKEVAKSQ